MSFSVTSALPFTEQDIFNGNYNTIATAAHLGLGLGTAWTVFKAVHWIFDTFNPRNGSWRRQIDAIF